VSLLLISHDLKSSAKDYAPFYEAIKNGSQEWWHFLESTWLVTTHLSADQFAKLLYPHMLNTDSLLVIKVQKDYQGWLATEAWDWLNEKYF
jgi:hypothetical protein